MSILDASNIIADIITIAEAFKQVLTKLRKKKTRKIKKRSIKTKPVSKKEAVKLRERQLTEKLLTNPQEAVKDITAEYVVKHRDEIIQGLVDYVVQEV